MPRGLPVVMEEMELIKSNMLHYLIETPGSNLSTAAISQHISKSLAYQWRQQDPQFDQSVKWAMRLNRQVTDDFVENSLLKLVRQGNPAATIFYAKCRMKARGYREQAPMVEQGNAAAAAQPQVISFTLNLGNAHINEHPPVHAPTPLQKTE